MEAFGKEKKGLEILQKHMEEKLFYINEGWKAFCGQRFYWNEIWGHFWFYAHTRIYPKEPQNWSGRSKLKKKGRNWHKSAVPWASAERIKKHLKLAQRVSTNWQLQVFYCTNCCLAFISLSSIAMVWTSWRRFCQNYQPLQKQCSCKIGSRLKLWPLWNQEAWDL